MEAAVAAVAANVGEERHWNDLLYRIQNHADDSSGGKELFSTDLAGTLFQAAARCLSTSSCRAVIASCQSTVLDVLLLLCVEKCCRWSDGKIYAALVGSGKEGLLTALEEIILILADDSGEKGPPQLSQKDENDPSSKALIVLSHLWEALARWDADASVVPFSIANSAASTTSNKSGIPWWMPIERRIFYQKLVHRCVELWKKSVLRRKDHTQNAPAVAAAAVSILFHCGRQHDYGSCYASSSSSSSSSSQLPTVTDLMHRLASQAKRLHDTAMPDSSLVHLSLHSLRLFQALASNTTTEATVNEEIIVWMEQLQPHLVECVWGSDSTTTMTATTNSWSAPRWCQRPSNTTRRLAASILLECQTISTATTTVPSTSLQRLWERVLCRAGSSDDAQPLVWAYEIDPRGTQQALEAALKKQASANNSDYIHHDDDSIYRNLWTSLWSCTQLSSDAYPARLMNWVYACTSNSRSCRISIRNGVDHQWVHRLQEHLRQLNQKPEASAKLALLLDLLWLILAHNDAAGIPRLESTKSVETLVQIMRPTVLQPILMEDGNTSIVMIDSEESTPNTNNLSVDVSLCRHAEPTLVPTQGIDDTVRLAAATLVAELLRADDNSSSNEPTKKHPLHLQKRLGEALQDYFAETVACKNHRQTHRDLCRRRHRLMRVMGEEYESLWADLAFAAESSASESAQRAHRDLHRCQQELAHCRAQADVDQKRHQAELQAQTSQKRNLQAQLARDKGRYISETQLLFRAHQVELRVAQEAAAKAEQLSSEGQDRADRAERALQQSMVAEKESKRLLEVANDELVKKTHLEQTNREKCTQLQRDCQQFGAELRQSKESLQRSRTAQVDKDEKIAQQQKMMSRMDESQLNLRDSLENLFGDMVSLAELYESTEKEVAGAKHHAQDELQMLKRELEKSKRRNALLEERNSQFSAENEILSKKYARAKEKIQQERQQQQELQKQRQHRESQRSRSSRPVSYINQLHESLHSESGKAFTNKENDFRYSSSSRRSRTHR